MEENPTTAAPLPNDPIAAEPVVATNPLPTEVLPPTTDLVREPAPDLLKLLLDQNNLEISLPSITTRGINDGSLIIDLPQSVNVKYRDE